MGTTGRLPSLAEGPARLPVTRSGEPGIDRLVRGFPRSSTSLFYGDAGTGKSSLLLRMTARRFGPVLVVCPEMSAGVLGNLARRARADRSQLVRCPEPERWAEVAQSDEWRSVLIDSVSRFARPAETLEALITWSQRRQGYGFAVAHLADDGDPLGPAALRHDPDAVFFLSLRKGARAVTVRKCRWGGTGTRPL